MSNRSNADTERAYLLGLSVDPDKATQSNADLRDQVYVDRQTPYASDPATNRSAADAELEARRAASVNPDEQFMSLADLRREAWDV
jgi:SLT domain-containing protein